MFYLIKFNVSFTRVINLAKMEKEGKATSNAATATTTRIFLGGLGENINESDVEKVFSSSPLGKIEGIEIIRTKGRSFAYFNFFPSSDKSLAKLFTMYNGCVWKGGRLRLEKAKEHYLNRLRREWAEDEDQAQAQARLLQNNASSDNNKFKPSKSLDLKMQQQKLKIFFPRLRKVKMVPLCGTGKHKYSFQRIDAPSVPLYFCDCEEHACPATATAPSLAFSSEKGKEIHDVEAQNGGMHDEEINLMNSVMKRLFERENPSKSAVMHGCSETQLAAEGDIFVKSIDNLQPDENELDSTDHGEDDLIINLVSRNDDKGALSGRWLHKSITENGETNFFSKRASKDGSIQKVPQEEKNDIPSNTKRKFHLLQESRVANSGQIGSAKTHSSSSETPLGDQTFLPADKKKKTHIFEESNRKVLVSGNSGGGGNSQIHFDEPGAVMPLGARTTLLESGIRQSSSSLPWSQKSSWIALVGDRTNSSFSVSDLLSDSSKDKQPRSDSLNLYDSSNRKKQELKEHRMSEDESDETKVEHVLAQAELAEGDVISTITRGGSSWFQKSSWTQLVNEDNSSFSITQILPSITFEKHVMVTVDNANSGEKNGFDSHNQDENDPRRNVLSSVGHRKAEYAVNPLVKKGDIAVGNDGASDPIVDEKSFSRDINVGEKCTFMRSAASLKEWTNIKAALSRSRKRQSDKK